MAKIRKKQIESPITETEISSFDLDIESFFQHELNTASNQIAFENGYVQWKCSSSGPPATAWVIFVFLLPEDFDSFVSIVFGAESNDLTNVVPTIYLKTHDGSATVDSALNADVVTLSAVDTDEVVTKVPGSSYSAGEFLFVEMKVALADSSDLFKMYNLKVKYNKKAR